MPSDGRGEGAGSLLFVVPPFMAVLSLPSIATCPLYEAWGHRDVVFLGSIALMAFGAPRLLLLLNGAVVMSSALIDPLPFLRRN